MARSHEWALVAPWYRWAQQAKPGRKTRPVFQKYETSDLVNVFLKDPQETLKFNADDVVYTTGERTVERIPMSAPPALRNKKRELTSKQGSGFSDKVPTLTATTLRKIFLDTHKRFYLVVCELHCDEPGFPNANRDEACEAGFVIRRRRWVFQQHSAKEAGRILKQIAGARLKIAKLQAEAAKEPVNAAKPTSGLGKVKAIASALVVYGKSGSVEQQLATATEGLAAEQKKLADWAVTSGAHELHEGWVPSGFDKIGSWQAVPETPAETNEVILPLHALIPDPRDDKHSGKGRAIYFGLLPTGSADTEDDGSPRFDTTSLYEVRCFVRRHKPDCPRLSTRGDCPGPLVWSAPTDSYRLAAHFDLVGTSNRPVTMQLPDLAELEAQAASLPAPKVAPFRMASPPKSNLEFDVDPEEMKASPKPPSGQICSFSIPLITIVATFVFKLFLPILTFLFGLFFLLKLKFCIPPSIEIDLGLKAELDVVLPKIEVDASFDVDVSVGLSIPAVPPNPAKNFPGQAANPSLSASDLHAHLETDLNAKLSPGVAVGVGTVLANDFGNGALAKYESELATDFDTEEHMPSLSASLELEERVEVST
jgi:hypothetical protein